MPPAFEFPTSTNVEAWTPLAFDPKDMHGRSRRARSLTVVGRMADGVDAAAGAARSQRACGADRERVQGQQRRMERARGGCARPIGRRVAAGVDGADGRGGIPAADRLRQHGEPAAGAAVEPSSRNGRARRARREPMGSGAAGHRREPAAVVHRRRARTDPRQRRPAPARDDEGSAAAAHGSTAAGRRRAAVHDS